MILEREHQCLRGLGHQIEWRVRVYIFKSTWKSSYYRFWVIVEVKAARIKVLNGPIDAKLFHGTDLNHWLLRSAVTGITLGTGLIFLRDLRNPLVSLTEAVLEATSSFMSSKRHSTTPKR